MKSSSRLLYNRNVVLLDQPRRAFGSIVTIASVGPSVDLALRYDTSHHMIHLKFCTKLDVYLTRGIAELNFY